VASWWYSPSATSANNSQVLSILKLQGGCEAVTVIIMSCGDYITNNGTFVRGVSLGCDALIPELHAMGIGAERVVGGFLAGLQAAFANPTPSINAMVALAKELSLYGYSSDYEMQAAKPVAQAYACYQAKLRVALNAVGTRLTMFNDDFDGLIDDYADLQHGVDRLLDGDTCAFACQSCSSSLSSLFLQSVRVPNVLQPLLFDAPWSRSGLFYFLDFTCFLFQRQLVMALTVARYACAL
jgi:hypothetical protein